MRPSEVRLHPSEKDEYRWVFSATSGHLFDKQLSDMSTNMYIELSSSILRGNVRAVRHEAESAPISDLQTICPDLEKELQDSMEIIERLEQEIQRYKQKEDDLVTQNRRLRQALALYHKNGEIIGRCLGKTERQICEFLKVTKFNT